MATSRVAGVEVATAHFIGGKRVESPQTFAVRSPIDGGHLAEVSAGGSRNSGIGREGGTWSFDFYCDVKNIATLKGSFA